ncbi:MAG: 2OG-Fe(II) oxygenase [Pseudomonadota bacterium]
MPKLSDYILTADQVLDAETCRELIDLFEKQSSAKRANGAGVRAGLEESAWTELDLARAKVPALQAKLLACARHVHAGYGTAVNLGLPLPQPKRYAEWVIKRYLPNGKERFQTHFDAVNEVSNRYLVYLWYLNDVDEGGETVFPDIGLQVAPKAGRLLMFPPYWMYQHGGLPPRSGPKYILSTYALF